ncbi:MAG: CoA transferase, partial [Gammaproteobacteria bacterium]|nr:CoA transferase [Gammaproteobacteria bacterium]
LEGAGVTVGRVMDYTEVSDFEQYRQHEAIVDIEHPEYGKLSTFGTPAKFSETPCKPEQPAPKLGQHNREIYGELLGMDPQEEQRLKELGIV